MHLQTFEVLESELILSRNAILRKFRLVRTFFDTIVYTKPRKLFKVDDANSWCEHSLGDGETIDIFIFAKFVICREIRRA